MQDAVALGDALLVNIENGAIERVRHGANELPGGVARQLCIGVKRDYILHCRQFRDPADNAHEVFFTSTTQ